ncbi:hypothetical protein HanPSC8_Chr03g0085201 [Helianthus annuus]|nr:hypothetical protein HanPSC8_Chr03g0085201 [Helianthus annuus]
MAKYQSRTGMKRLTELMYLLHIFIFLEVSFITFWQLLAILPLDVMHTLGPPI